jgi:hypothetical protein
MAEEVLEQIIPVGSTGNGTFSMRAENADIFRAALQFLVEVAGATPTVTFDWQGSLDGSNWVSMRYTTDLVDTVAQGARAVTAVGAYPEWMYDQAGRFFRKFRVVVTANTNVTYSAVLALQSRT